MQTRNPSVDGFLRKAKTWRAELLALREILLDTPLAEEIKWRQPCYTFGGANLIIMGELKACATLGFLKGSLLKDPEGILEPVGQNARAAMMVRFTSVDDVRKLEPTLRKYIAEAIDLERAGAKIDWSQGAEVPVPAELEAQFVEMPELRDAFAKLTPGRQRAYLLHFNGAKQSATRASRIEKCTPMILEGIGLDDAYKQKLKAKPRRGNAKR